MSFLDSVKTNKPAVGGGVNPFATSGGTKMSNNTNNPFAPKTPATPAAPAAPAFNVAVGAGAPPVTPGKPGVPKPSFPGAPKAPSAPGMAPKPTMPKAPTPTQPAAAEPVKEVSTEEMIKDIKETVIEAPVEPKVEEPKVEEPKVEATKVEEPKAEEVKVEAEAKEDKKPKSRKSAAKKKTETTADIVDSPTDTAETADIVENLFKMPSTSVKYPEAIQAIKSKFVDEEWEAFRAKIISESDEIVIEADMQEGAMKKTIAKLNALREQIWVNFVDTKSLFESLSNKDTDGLIERVKFASLEGSNETVRKKAGVLAVMNYVTPEGEKINLYEVYDETKSRFYFLKSVMETIKYKSDVLITMSSAIKMEKNHSNN